VHFRQFYLGCLAHASYLIGSEAEAAVIDPQRDVQIYLDEAQQHGFVIRHVIETHCHADFISGHRELAARTGAKVYFGAKASPKFEFVGVREDDEIRFGAVTLRFLETPGHTPESMSILVFDCEKSSSTPEAVLTGDTMFIGDVGRPDLLGSRMAPEELAGMLYDSLHHKLLKLPDQVKVFPAHGAGSMCGRNISSETSSTIGDQRKFNYALQPMKREDFVKMMTTDLPEAPSYFGMDAQINLEGPNLLQELPQPKPLFPAEVQRRQKEGHLVLDTRTASQYGAGHVPNSLNVCLSGQFASWAGIVIRPDVPLIIVAEDEAHVREAQIRLARVGLEKVAGYLVGGIFVWNQSKLPLAATEQISVEELNHRLDEKSVDHLLDVRRKPEWNAGHIAKADRHPLNHLAETADRLPRDARIAVICAGGFRSSIGTSILERMGFQKITNVVGGMTAWNNAKLPSASETLSR